MRRNGISDVITSLILIMTTVSLATVFFFWALGYMGQSQTATAAGINQNNGRVQEQSAVNQVRFWLSSATNAQTIVSSGDMVTVYVRNYGDIPVTIDHVYFNGVLFQGCSGGSLGTSTTYCFAPAFAANCIPSAIPLSPVIATQMASATGATIVVSARAVGCINIALTYYTNAHLVAWNVGDTDTIIVASTRGNQFTQAFTVPTQNFG
jgi:flagellin-like protein